tara:strand:+ start:133 stop:483 length:351 start_codon:yes stop_codon:yes gene_type:complete
MNFTKSIEVCFNKFTNFEGRARKSEFWWFQLFCIIVQIVGSIIDALLGYVELFVWIGYIIVLLPSVAVGARRLHDTGRSGWWQLLVLTIIGVVVLIVWWVADGDKKKNKFGQPIKL